MRSTCALRLALIGVVVATATGRVHADAAAIPYRSFQPVIDGDASEWRQPWHADEFAETTGAERLRNRVRSRMAWDLDALYLALEVDDADPIPAPADIGVDAFHLYDSIQVYVDAQGNATPAMDRDDVDILLLADGRSAVLRGDELLATLTDAKVPQRVATPLPLEFATRGRPDGWSAELRIPFAGLGIAPKGGHGLGLDLAMSDWRTGSAALREVLPLDWNGARDFGYPQGWRRMQLSGGPPPLERALRRYGGAAVLGAVAGALTLVGVAAFVGLWWLNRRRLRRLLARLARRGGAPIPPRAPSDAVVTAAQPTAAPEGATEPAPDARDAAFAERVLAYVRAHLAQALGPAELASAFHVSVRTLQRRLKAGLATTPQDLVLAARLEAARCLLAEGRWRVGEVAAQVGFDDPSHFTRRFRAAYGQAPSQLSSPQSRPD